MPTTHLSSGLAGSNPNGETLVNRLKIGLFFSAVLTLLVTIAPTCAFSESPTLNPKNTWIGPGVSEDYFSPPAEMAALIMAENMGDILVTGFQGPFTTPQFGLECSTSNPCYNINAYQYSDHNFLGGPLVQYVGTASYGTLYADGTYLATGQTYAGKNLGNEVLAMNASNSSCNCPDP